MKKKLLLNMGALLLGTTSTLAVVSCNENKTNTNGDDKSGNNGASGADGDQKNSGNKSNPPTKGKVKKEETKEAKVITKEEKIETIQELVGYFKKDLSTSSKKAIANGIINFFDGGLKSLSQEQLKEILSTFGISDSISKIAWNLLNSDILERLVKTGFKDLTDKVTAVPTSPKYYDEKVDAIKDLVESILPPTKDGSNDIFTRELLTKILVGFKDSKDLADTFGNLLSSIKFDKIFAQSLKDMVKNLYSQTPLLENGILFSSEKEWESSFLTIKGAIKSIDPIIKVMKVNLSDNIRKILNVFENLDSDNIKSISKSVSELLKGGIKSIEKLDVLANLIAFFTKEIDNDSLQKKNLTFNAGLKKWSPKTKVALALEEVKSNGGNLVDSLKKILNNGLSKPDWEATLDDFVNNLKSVLSKAGVDTSILPMAILAIKELK